MVLKNALIATVTHDPIQIRPFNLLLIMALGAATGRRFIESGMDTFFSNNDPSFLTERQLQQTYGREDNILFVIHAVGVRVAIPKYCRIA